MTHHPEEHQLKRIEREVLEILSILKRQPSHFTIEQIQGEFMSVTGIVAGATGTFQEVVTAPPGAVFPAGTTFVWTVDDTADTALTPSVDTTQVAIAVSTAPAQTSFNLICTSNFTPPGANAPLAVTKSVPILTAPVNTPTAMDINQLS